LEILGANEPKLGKCGFPRLGTWKFQVLELGKFQSKRIETWKISIFSKTWDLELGIPSANESAPVNIMYTSSKSGKCTLSNSFDCMIGRNSQKLNEITRKFKKFT